MAWNPVRETFVLRYLCYNDPLVGQFDEFLAKLAHEISGQFEESFTKEDLSSKIYQYYDIDALSALKPSKTNEVEKDNSKTQTETKPSKHVTIDEDQNKIFSSRSTSLTLNEQEIKPILVENEKNLKHITENTGSDHQKDVSISTTDSVKPNSQQKSEHECFPESVQIDRNPDSIDNQTDTETSINGLSDKENLTKIKFANEGTTSLAPEQQVENLEEEQQLEDGKKEEEVPHEEKESEEEEEEPAHLTRAQAKKLQIDVEKEIVQTEKKSREHEENINLTEAKPDDLENTSLVLESEADDSEPTAKRTRVKRNSKADHEPTQRRSSRLRRKSEGDISDSTSGRDKKSGKTHTVEPDIEEEELSPKHTTPPPKRRGRRSKSVSTMLEDPESVKNTTQSAIDSIENEKENDKDLIQNKDDKTNDDEGEAEHILSTRKDDSEEPDSVDAELRDIDNDDGESILDVESADDSDSDRNDRPRRSSRKRKLDVNDEHSSKKPKSDVPVTPVPKRRGRKPKVESRENSTEVDDNNTPNTRRSTRRRP